MCTGVDEKGKKIYGMCEKLYGIKMGNYTALYKGRGRDREQSEEKNKWAKERGKRLRRKMKDDRGKG